MKRRKTTGRIYPGEYCLPGDRTAAQREFFRAIRRKTPEVLESLCEHLLPVFERFCDEGRADKDCLLELYRLAWDWAAGHHLVAGERLIPVGETCRGLTDAEVKAKYAEFKDSSEQNFFFPLAWFAILGTLQEWHENPRSAGLDWVLPYRPYAIGDGSELLKLRTRSEQFQILDLFTPPLTKMTIPCTFQCPGWNPLEESRSQAKERILDEVEKALDHQLDQVENLMTLFDVPAAPTKLCISHFGWLVLYFTFRAFMIVRRPMG